MIQERIALWGNIGNPEKEILLALSLRLADRKVDIWFWDKISLPQGFANDMMKKWMEGEEVSFAEGVTHREQPLNDQSVLPQDIRVEKPESIRKIQNEWAYEILAQKTHESFSNEIKELESKIAEANEYKSEYWDTAKSIWDRALRLRNDNMLRKQYAEDIKDKINKTFEKLKVLRDDNTKVIQAQSELILQEYSTELNNMLSAIEQGTDLQTRFNELKQLQEKIKHAKILLAHKKTLWASIDHAFESIKSKRSSKDVAMIDGRINGLKQVVVKMEKGLKRDKDELDFQHKRRDNKGSSQIEMQLRKAKIQVLEDTIKSKEEKLADIYKTINELEQRAQKIQAKTKAQTKQENDNSKEEKQEELSGNVEVIIDANEASAMASTDAKESENSENNAVEKTDSESADNAVV